MQGGDEDDNDNDNNDGDGDDDMLCEMAWDSSFASVFHIRQGIDYLRKIHGDCTNGPGPGNCSRVSCSYQSGIWFCNDNPHPISVPCSAFGDRAWDIVEKCYAHGGKCGAPRASFVFVAAFIYMGKRRLAMPRSPDLSSRLLLTITTGILLSTHF